jgi:hypothetical protein
MELDLVVPPLVTALLLPSVADFMELVGGTVSTVQLNEAGDEPLFPTLSSDLICSVWMPSPRLVEVNCIGLVQTVNLELSILHSEWSTPTPLSILENKKIIDLEDVLPPAVMTLLLPSVAESIVVAGGDVSTVHVNDAGERSLFPTLS